MIGATSRKKIRLLCAFEIALGGSPEIRWSVDEVDEEDMLTIHVICGLRKSLGAGLGGGGSDVSGGGNGQGENGKGENGKIDGGSIDIPNDNLSTDDKGSGVGDDKGDIGNDDLGDKGRGREDEAENPDVFTVCFCGTGCARDEGEKTRRWDRLGWQFWMKSPRSICDKRIYDPQTGYIPVRINKEISGDLKSKSSSISIRGVGENDWFDQKNESDPLQIDGPLNVPEELVSYVRKAAGGNQRTLREQARGTSATALALHAANVAAASSAKQLNFIGHSRGGMEAIMAAWFLYAYGKSDIPVNIFAIDPVPGPGNWYGIITQLPPNVRTYVGVYAWDHLDTGFTPVVPRPNHKMWFPDQEIQLGGNIGATWSGLADDCQLADPLAATDKDPRQLEHFKLFMARGRHGTVAGNQTCDGQYDPEKVSDDVSSVPRLVYRMVRAYLTKWGTEFSEPCAVAESVDELRRKMHLDHAPFDLMGYGESRTSRLPTRQYVRRVSSISGRNPMSKYYLEDAVGEPPYRLAYPVTIERTGHGVVQWDFL